MKRLCFLLMVAVVCGSSVYGGYDYVIEKGRYGLPDLDGYETLLMTGGGGSGMHMTDHSSARIEGTSPLDAETGGIWHLVAAGESHLEFLGGEVHQLSVDSFATAVLAGGRIDRINSGQQAWKYAGEPPTLQWNAHITFVCDLASVDYNTQTKMLTGNWRNGTAFNIQLIDEAGYSSVIENIQFIPEPATLLLMGAGMMLMRKRR
jgi:hypothetical protein